MLARLVTVAGCAVIGYFVVALGLILSDSPDTSAAPGGGNIDFGSAISADYSDLPPLKSYEARDGAELHYRRYDGADDAQTLVILIHGSGWHGMQFHPMASELAKRGLGTVIAPDMRGHGSDPERRGDVDYIGQIEDDIADLIDHLGTNGDFSRIVLGGHSSGGGFVLRFAGSDHGGMADAYILLAPFLKYNAPTTKQDSGGWARPATRRIIGLSMLNAVGITALNDLPAIGFAMPQAVLDGPYGDTATTLYTYRMNTAFSAHSDYESDLAAIGQPLLVVAGGADESFHAERYAPVISPHVPDATVKVLPDVTHMGVVTGAAAIDAVAGWLETIETEDR